MVKGEGAFIPRFYYDDIIRFYEIVRFKVLKNGYNEQYSTFFRFSINILKKYLH